MRRLLSYRFVPLHVSRNHMFFSVLRSYDHMMVHTLKFQSCTNLLRSYAVIDWKIGKLLKFWSIVITTVHQKENRWAWLTCSVGWEFLDLALKQFPSVYNATLHTGSFPQYPGLHISCRLCSTLTVSAIVPGFDLAGFCSCQALLWPGAALASFLPVLVLVLFVLIWLFFAVSRFCSSQVL